MQNNQMTTVRGFAPQQNTGNMQPIPYQYQQPVPQQPMSPADKLKALWNQLDPVAVALLASAVLGVGYALFATISYWWFTRILIHIILIWLTVVLNGVAMITGKRDLMLGAAAGYIIALLLFLNHFYLLLPQPLLCLWAWNKSNQ